MNEQILQAIHLSPMQKRIWLLQSASPVYFVQIKINVTGKLNEARLADSIQSVIRKYDILRVAYTRQANVLYPLQVVRESISCRFEKGDVASTGDTLFEEFNLEQDDDKSLLCPRLYKNRNDNYTLVLRLPAIAGDVVTIQKIAAEIATIYNQINEFEEQKTPTIQYGQFAEWQLDLNASPDVTATDFWETDSFEKGNEYNLPFINYETTGGIFIPAVSSLTLSTDTCAQLMVLERRGLPTKMILMACFYLFLNRFLPEDEITIGYAVSGREYDELKDIIGLLSTTIPVLIKPLPEETLIELIKRLEEQSQKIKEYGEFFSWPLSTQDNLLPYFRSIYEYTEMDIDRFQAEDVRFNISEVNSVTDQFDIKFNVLKDGEDLRFQLYYNSSILNQIAANTMAAQINDLVQEAVLAPEETVATIIARSAKQVFYKSELNTAESEAENIIQLFREKVKILGDSIAIQDGGESLTYKELDRQTSQLAAWLSSERNIKPGNIVALCVSRSINMIVSMLAILKTGAAYLPIDVKTPKARIRYIMEDSLAVILITDTSTQVEIAGSKALILNEAFWNKLSKADPGTLFQCKRCKKCGNLATSAKTNCKNAGLRMPSSATAYVIYTSGSTGNPKGVIVSHGSLVNYVHWFISKYDINENDRTILFSSIAFDLSYTSLWSSLLGGATLYIHKEKEYLDPVELITDLIDNEVTFIKLTPSHFSFITKDCDFETNCKKYSLRLVVLGGEEIIADDIERYLIENPATKFVNHYGPTEATIGILTKNIDIHNIRQFQKKTILGKAITNNQVFILDKGRKRLCVAGEIGEICVTGKGVATGYLNRKELTAEKFILLPFLNDAINYQTGDLGRWMPDGNIEFLGRKDFQVKIRGYRIEIGEVEEALLSFSEVEDVNIQILEDEKTKDKRLVAFLKSPVKINRAELHNKLQTMLPDYMIPAEFIGVAAFPLLPNGKIDRSALQVLASQFEAIGSVDYIAPSNNTEKILVGIWKEVISGKDFGIKHNFFDLGGHSLKAAQLVSRIYKIFNKKIEIRSIFDYPTVEQLARLINMTNKSKAYESIPVVPELEYYEVSHAQKRLWLLNHFKKDKISYNSSSYYRINGSLQTEILSQAFKELIERHESLRTTFSCIDEQPWQKINSYNNCGFKLVTADVRSSDDPYRSADELALSCYYDEFDLERGPLLRAMSIQTGDEEWLLTCNIHHIVYDGWSLNIFFNELLTIYSALEKNKKNPLKPLAIQYKDYAAWSNAMINYEEEEYWLKKLANYPKLISLPYDKVEVPDEQQYARQSICINEQDSSILKQIAKKSGTTLSNLFLTLYGLFINQVSGQEDIMIGIGHANRSHEDVENLIGFFINMLVIRMQFSADDTLNELVKQVSENSVAAFQHSNYPFDLLVEKLCVNRYADRQPLVNVMYDFKNFHDIQLQKDNLFLESSLKIEEIRIGETISAHDLILHVIDNKRTILFYFEYKKECFLPETIINFYHIFKKLIHLCIGELSQTAVNS